MAVSTLSGILNGRSAGHSPNFTAILDALFPDATTVAVVGRQQSPQEAEARKRQSDARQALSRLWDEATRRISAEGGKSGGSSARGGSVPPRVDRITRRALLGIHEAIPLPAGASADLAADLPLYVPRDADTQIRAALTGFRTTGGFVLLVGGAATGKTRTVHEALLAVVPDWTFVVPADGASVAALADGYPASSGTTGSVLWLDELQNFLVGPAPLAAATVRSLLTEAAPPVIIIGTMWPEVYERLRADGPEPGSGGGDDRARDVLEDIRASSRNAREVLAMAQRIDLAAFGPAEWERAAAAAARDPRIAHALRHKGDFSLPQALAGAPELLRRWTTSDQPYGKALLTAAVTARRAGHGFTVPADFLEAVAPSFLNGRQRAAAGAAWFEDALAWACEPVFPHTEIALLSPDGQAMGRVDGYRVSAVLSGHLDINWLTIPPEVWPVMVAAAAPEARRNIGLNAEMAGYPEVARAAWQDAADQGDLASMSLLGLLSSGEGRLEEARKLLAPVAECGSPTNMHNLAGVLRRQGDLDGAHHWYRRAAGAGFVFSMISLGESLYALGEREEGLAWVRRAAVDFGGQPAMTSYAGLLHAEGQIAAARHWLVQAAEQYYAPARQMLAAQLYEEGDTASAWKWLTLVAEDTAASNVHRAQALHTLGEMRRRQGDLDGAHDWWERAAELPPYRKGAVNPAGVASMHALGLLAQQRQDVSTARRWFSRAAEAGSTDAVYALGVMADAEGDPVGAAGFWRRAAESGHVDSMLRLGRQANLQGDVLARAHWFAKAAEKGSGAAETVLGVLLSESDPAAARHWFTRAAERGTTQAIQPLVKVLEQSGDAADAEEARRWRAELVSGDVSSGDGGPQPA